MATDWQQQYELKEQTPFTLDGHPVYQLCTMKDIFDFKSGDIIEVEEKEYGLLCFVIKEDKLFAKYFDLDIKEGSFYEIAITDIIKGTGSFTKEEMKEVTEQATTEQPQKATQEINEPSTSIEPIIEETPTNIEPIMEPTPTINGSPVMNTTKETKKKAFITEETTIKPDRPKREGAGKKKMDDAYEQEPKKKKAKPKHTTSSEPADDVKNILALLQSQQALMVKQQETILQMQQQQQDKQELTAMIKVEKNNAPTQLAVYPCSSSTANHDNKYPLPSSSKSIKTRATKLDNHHGAFLNPCLILLRCSLICLGLAPKIKCKIDKKMMSKIFINDPSNLCSVVIKLIEYCYWMRS